MHDNIRLHIARTVAGYLGVINAQILYGHPRTPYHNSIEHLLPSLNVILNNIHQEYIQILLFYLPR